MGIKGDATRYRTEAKYQFTCENYLSLKCCSYYYQGWDDDLINGLL